jgi:hypothetical protein
MWMGGQDFGSDVKVYGLNSSDGLVGVYLFPNRQVEHNKHK